MTQVKLYPRHSQTDSVPDHPSPALSSPFLLLSQPTNTAEINIPLVSGEPCRRGTSCDGLNGCDGCKTSPYWTVLTVTGERRSVPSSGPTPTLLVHELFGAGQIRSAQRAVSSHLVLSRLVLFLSYVYLYTTHVFSLAFPFSCGGIFFLGQFLHSGSVSETHLAGTFRIPVFRCTVPGFPGYLFPTPVICCATVTGFLLFSPHSQVSPRGSWRHIGLQFMTGFGNSWPVDLVSPSTYTLTLHPLLILECHPDSIQMQKTDIGTRSC